MAGTLERGVLDGVVWTIEEAGRTDDTGVAMGVPGPCMGTDVPKVPSARLEGGRGGLTDWLEPGAVAEVVEVGPAPIGEEVTATEAPETGSEGKISPCVDGTPPPRSIKRERSFLSRAWMSSGLPTDSEEASDLVSHSPQCVCV